MKFAHDKARKRGNEITLGIEIEEKKTERKRLSLSQSERVRTRCTYVYHHSIAQHQREQSTTKPQGLIIGAQRESYFGPQATKYPGWSVGYFQLYNVQCNCIDNTEIEKPFFFHFQIVMGFFQSHSARSRVKNFEFRHSKYFESSILQSMHRINLQSNFCFFCEKKKIVYLTKNPVINVTTSFMSSLESQTQKLSGSITLQFGSDREKLPRHFETDTVFY